MEFTNQFPVCIFGLHRMVRTEKRISLQDNKWLDKQYLIRCSEKLIINFQDYRNNVIQHNFV